MGRLTIAIAGAERKTGSVLANKLAKQKSYRLLLVTEEESLLNSLSSDIRQNSPDAELETIGCLRDGCWEADIIMLDIPPYSAMDAAKKIREVSTQKIVFDFSAIDPEMPSAAAGRQEWQQLLPDAKVVTALNILTTGKVVLTGNDQESVQIISDIINKIGFHIHA